MKIAGVAFGRRVDYYGTDVGWKKIWIAYLPLYVSTYKE